MASMSNTKLFYMSVCRCDSQIPLPLSRFVCADFACKNTLAYVPECDCSFPLVAPFLALPGLPVTCVPIFNFPALLSTSTDLFDTLIFDFDASCLQYACTQRRTVAQIVARHYHSKVSAWRLHYSLFWHRCYEVKAAQAHV